MADEIIEVTDNKAAQRYEVTLEGSVAVLEYAREGNSIRLIHTEVPPALEGRGIAGRLAETALNDARSRSMRVIPVCAFVQSYISRHPAYRELVDAASE